MPHSVPEVLLPPADITLFPHQSEAIRSWAKAGGRGVLEMATGSGKTITGLSLASRLYDGADRQTEIDGRSYPYVIAEHDPAECTIIREVREES